MEKDRQNTNGGKGESPWIIGSRGDPFMIVDPAINAVRSKDADRLEKGGDDLSESKT